MEGNSTSKGRYVRNANPQSTLLASTRPASPATLLVEPSAPMTKSARSSVPVLSLYPSIRPSVSEWLDGLAAHRGGPGFDRHVMERGVEHGSRHRRAVSRVVQSLPRREAYATASRTQNDDVTHFPPGWWWQTEVGQHLEGARTDDVTARFVTGKCRLVHQCHRSPASRQAERRDAARWACTYDDDVIT